MRMKRLKNTMMMKMMKRSLKKRKMLSVVKWRRMKKPLKNKSLKKSLIWYLCLDKAHSLKLIFYFKRFSRKKGVIS